MMEGRESDSARIFTNCGMERNFVSTAQSFYFQNISAKRQEFIKLPSLFPQDFPLGELHPKSLVNRW
jgi:hypothetical protein